MINRKPTRKYAALKSIFIFPVVALVIYAFGTPEYISASYSQTGQNNGQENYEQLMEVKGKVVQPDNQPLSEALILVKGTSLGVSTNKDGSFRLQYAPDYANPDQPYVEVEKMPRYPGGDKELLNFIKNNTKYPEELRAAKIEGKVTIRFIVNTEGKVEGLSVIKGLNPLMDAEAMRVISILPKWTPGTHGGKPVKVCYMAPVTFSLSPGDTKTPETPKAEPQVNVAGVVAVTNMNFLYRGIPNPIEIAVPGVTSDKVTVATTNGTINRTPEGWAVIPLSTEDLVLTIFVENKKMNEKNFRVKPIPAPAAVFAGKNIGSVSKDDIKTATLKAELKDFPWELKFEIESFTFAFSKDGFDREIASNGNRLTDEMRSIISGLKRGQYITFRNIKALGPDGKISDLNPLVLTID